MHYYKYRHYNPALGRWLSRDPIQEQGGLNLYRMVANDPVNLYDVHGLFIPPHILGGAIIGAISGAISGATAAVVAADSCENGRTSSFGAAILGGITGAISGGLTGGALAAVGRIDLTYGAGGIVGGAVAGGVAAGVVSGLSGGDWKDVTSAVAGGAFTGGLIGALNTAIGPKGSGNFVLDGVGVATAGAIGGAVQVAVGKALDGLSLPTNNHNGFNYNIDPRKMDPNRLNVGRFPLETGDDSFNNRLP